MSMSIAAIEEFAERLVQECRDHAIWAMDLLLRPNRQGKDADRWQAAAIAADGIVPPRTVIPDSVDSALCSVLYDIDSQERLHLLFRMRWSEMVDLVAAGGGELAGWYIGTGEWRPMYSKERFADDFADVPSEWGVATPELAPNLDDLEMPRRAIEELGILLVRHVRDVAIQSCDLQLLPHSQTPTAKRWRRAAIPFNGHVPPQVLIPDCVDEAIYAFLRAIDQGLLPLSYVSENGETVDLVKEGRGELAARYMAKDGWRAKYSKERINEDVAD